MCFSTSPNTQEYIYIYFFTDGIYFHSWLNRRDIITSLQTSLLSSPEAKTYVMLVLVQLQMKLDCLCEQGLLGGYLDTSWTYSLACTLFLVSQYCWSLNNAFSGYALWVLVSPFKYANLRNLYS